MDLITKKKGNIEETYDTEGHLLYSGTYKDGNGLLQTWYPSGVLKSEGYFKDNEPIGELKYYYENGQVSDIMRLNDDHKPDGIWEHWYPNGQLARQTEYRAGAIAYTDKRWDEKGQLECETHYDDRNQKRKEHTYYSNGQIEFEATWDEEGRRDGLSKHFNEQGQLIDSLLYRSGVFIKSRKWSDSGRLISKSQCSDNGDLKLFNRYSESSGNVLEQTREYKGNFLSEEWNETGSRIRRDVLVRENGPLLFKEQVKGFHLNKEQMMSLRYYQPVKLKGGWLQLDMDGQARYFKSDPTHICDEVQKLAQELEPALRDKLDRLGADPTMYIRIRSEQKVEADSLSQGNLQSLFQEKQRGNEHKF